jgi:hypothetical protein
MPGSSDFPICICLLIVRGVRASDIRPFRRLRDYVVKGLNAASLPTLKSPKRVLSIKNIMSSNLTLPPFKGRTVQVSILNGGTCSLRAEFIVHNPLPGHDVFTCPCYSFLIENKELGKRVLYDLGIIKEQKKLPPSSKYCIYKM